jgi:hypothetical protein
VPPSPAPSYLIAIAMGPLFQSFAENHMMFTLNVVGTRMRNALMAAIYRKCLRLSNSAMQSESTGKVRGPPRGRGAPAGGLRAGTGSATWAARQQWRRSPLARLAIPLTLRPASTSTLNLHPRW